MRIGPVVLVTIYSGLRALLCSAPIFWLADRGPAYFYCAKFGKYLERSIHRDLRDCSGERGFPPFIYSDVKKETSDVCTIRRWNNWRGKIRLCVHVLLKNCNQFTCGSKKNIDTVALQFSYLGVRSSRS